MTSKLQSVRKEEQSKTKSRSVTTRSMAISESDSLENLADRLKRARIDAGLSIREVASKSGLSSGSISKIERGSMVPSILNLIRLVRAYDKPLASFVDERVLGFTYSLTPKGKGLRVIATLDSGKKDFELEVLSAQLSSGVVEAGLITLQARGSTNNRQMSHSGEEIAYCLSGNVHLIFGAEKISLRQGDTIHFTAAIPHYYQNRASNIGKILYFISHHAK